MAEVRRATVRLRRCDSGTLTDVQPLTPGRITDGAQSGGTVGLGFAEKRQTKGFGSWWCDASAVRRDNSFGGIKVSESIAQPAAGEIGVTALDHTSLAVTDIDRAVDFYGRAFGYEVTWEDRGWTDLIQGYLGCDQGRADLVQMRSPISGHTVEFIAFYDLPRDYSGPTLPGSGHLCFRVSNVHDAVARARALGAEAVGQIVLYPRGGRGCYMRDPAGTVFELDEAPMNS